MSIAFADIAQLRVWTESEIAHRDRAVSAISETVKAALAALNPAWRFSRIEAPALSPRDLLSPEYSDDDLWVTPVRHADREMVLRAETTASSYDWVRSMHNRANPFRPPFCVWQVGKSYRREQQSVASRLRFFEFTQMEMQCLYRADTKADYRAAVMPQLERRLAWLCSSESRVVPSERLPSYALSTLDVEVMHLGKWREVASVSIRNDFAPDILNLEVAVGMDRVVEVFNSEWSAS